ncbi:sigma-70 family RNA polymerase sigma factor [Chloroflexi bacterium TSY]|nr:sigma-70 family RNA polymerase sigma factor [Chloroflexi bacterium TSY]
MNEEQRLLRQARSGDINAFHQLFAEFQGPLKSYLYRLTTDRGDTDDLTHDTFVRAFDKIDSFQGRSSLKTWVFSVATNLAMDFQRKRKRWPVDAQDQSRQVSSRSPEVIEAYLYLNQASPQGSYEMREHIDFCFTCIAKTLPIDQQVALLLKDVYAFRVKEIKIILEQSRARVQHLLHAARQTLVEIFDHRCALVNKNGICYQCTELNGLFNPKQEAQEELIKLEMVREVDTKNQEELFELRLKLIQGIDPLNAMGTDLHDFIMQRIRKVIGEVR